MKFIRENWIWVVAPIVLFALVVAAVVLLGSSPEDQHVYNIR